MACGENKGCSNSLVKKVLLSYDNFIEFLKGVSGKIYVIWGNLKLDIQKPLHLEKTSEETTIKLKGYIDEASKDEEGNYTSGIMSASDKEKLDSIPEEIPIYNIIDGNGLTVDDDGNVSMNLATTTKAGAMSSSDKEKLDGISVSGVKEGNGLTVDSDGNISMGLASEDGAGAMSSDDKVILDNLEELRASGELDSYSVKPSVGAIYFGATGLSNTVTFQLLKGDVVQEIDSYSTTYSLEGSTRTGTSYREITLSEDKQTLSIVVKRNNITQRTGYLSVTLIDASGKRGTVAVPVMCTSNSFLLAQGRISAYNGVYTDSAGRHLDVEDCYAGSLYHCYKTFDGSEINIRWLTRGRYFLEMPKAWEEYFGTFNSENIKVDAALIGIGGNEFARFLVFSIQSPGEYSSVGTVSEDCWGAVSVYGAIEKDEVLYGSDVCTCIENEAPMRYSIWYNSLAGSWKSSSLAEREDGSKLESGLRAKLSYGVSTDGTPWAGTGVYEPSLNVEMLYVDPETNEITKETVTPHSVSYEVINAPEGRVTVDESTGVVTIDASGTGEVVQFSIQATISYRLMINLQGFVYTTTAIAGGYIRS